MSKLLYLWRMKILWGQFPSSGICSVHKGGRKVCISFEDWETPYELFLLPPLCLLLIHPTLSNNQHTPELCWNKELNGQKISLMKQNLTSLHPFRCHNLPSSIEIITSNFPWLSLFSQNLKHFQNLPNIFPKTKLRGNNIKHNLARSCLNVFNCGLLIGSEDDKITVSAFVSPVILLKFCHPCRRLWAKIENMFSSDQVFY